MNENLTNYWRRVSLAAESAASPDDTGDVAAVLAAAMMYDALNFNRPVPRPTPEFNARLARAEVLAA